MVVATEQDEVVERALAAVRPVVDVVSVDKAMALAARELTSTVAGDERAAGRRWYRASSPPGADRVAGVVIADGDERAVAGEPARRLRRDARTVGDSSRSPLR